MKWIKFVSHGHLIYIELQQVRCTFDRVGSADDSSRIEIYQREAVFTIDPKKTPIADLIEQFEVFICSPGTAMLDWTGI
ncbi:MAG TPA: hypothetical protein VGN26_12035 [Armatimonadota bacterium]|jgi:hypothetical protein